MSSRRGIGGYHEAELRLRACAVTGRRWHVCVRLQMASAGISVNGKSGNPCLCHVRAEAGFLHHLERQAALKLVERDWNHPFQIGIRGRDGDAGGEACNA